MASSPRKNSESLTYRGRPLLRQDRQLYYGDMRDPYIVMMQILETRQTGKFEIASKVSVSLLRTAADVDPTQRVVKTSEKNGIYSALDIGAVWLERALSNSEG
jgi:hypothetical protein